MFKIFRNIFRDSNQNVTMDDLKLFIEKIKISIAILTIFMYNKSAFL